MGGQRPILQEFLHYLLVAGIAVVKSKAILVPGSLCVAFPSRLQVGSVRSLRSVRVFATPWTAARQASLSITNSRSLLKLTSIESVMYYKSPSCITYSKMKIKSFLENKVILNSLIGSSCLHASNRQKQVLVSRMVMGADFALQRNLRSKSWLCFPSSVEPLGTVMRGGKPYCHKSYSWVSVLLNWPRMPCGGPDMQWALIGEHSHQVIPCTRALSPVPLQAHPPLHQPPPASLWPSRRLTWASLPTQGRVGGM